MFTFLIIYFVGIVVVQCHPFSIVATKMPDYENRQNRKNKKNYLTFKIHIREKLSIGTKKLCFAKGVIWRVCFFGRIGQK